MIFVCFAKCVMNLPTNNGKNMWTGGKTRDCHVLFYRAICLEIIISMSDRVMLVEININCTLSGNGNYWNHYVQLVPGITSPRDSRKSQEILTGVQIHSTKASILLSHRNSFKKIKIAIVFTVDLLLVTSMQMRWTSLIWGAGTVINVSITVPET